MQTGYPWVVAFLPRALLGLIVLGRHPRPDVRRTVAKHSTPAGFVPSQDTDRVTICEDQISKIQDKDTPERLRVD
jgi:hypothetical protein